MDLGEEIDRFLDDDLRRQSISELRFGIAYLAAMLETELSDTDRKIVVEELCKHRDELANRISKTVGNA